MYSDEELAAARACLAKRRWRVFAPCAVAFALAVAVFVYGQCARNDSLWLLTVALTVVGGGALIFFSGVYLRPMRLYAEHVQTMLHGKKRETTGVLKSFDDAVIERDGILCHALYLNVGDKNEEQDDRLFYYDAQKPAPAVPLGARMTITSNDKMVADFKAV